MYILFVYLCILYIYKTKNIILFVCLYLTPLDPKAMLAFLMPQEIIESKKLFMWNSYMLELG